MDDLLDDDVMMMMMMMMSMMMMDAASDVSDYPVSDSLSSSASNIGRKASEGNTCKCQKADESCEEFHDYI